MYFSLNLSHYVKSFEHFWSNFGFFRMPAHQIWSYHVTQEEHFEKFSFCANSTFNIRKITKISSGKALCFISYQPKTSWGMENTHSLPSAFRVKLIREYSFQMKLIILWQKIDFFSGTHHDSDDGLLFNTIQFRHAS